MKKLLSVTLWLLCLAFAGCRHEEKSLSVIPIPLDVDLQKGTFVLNGNTKLWIKAPEEDRTILQECVARSPLQLEVATDRPTSNAVILEVVDSLVYLGSSEGYAMTVTKGGVVVKSLSGAGLFYAVQTLLQMMDEGHVPLGRIVDEPRLAYRGMMLDVSRHFFGVDFVKKQIDAMACYKLNHLHLHLTDAAGWRVEIKRYPRLTELAAWRTHAQWKDWWNGGRKYAEVGTEQAYGGYYTQEQVREIVEYARKHYITVIPEIEMPSHSEEVLAEYPELACSQIPYRDSDFCVGNEQVFEFIENVLTEVMELFPSQYIHIGGDEASKQSWKSCPRCSARMNAEGLAGVDGLQSYMIRRVEAFLNEHGRSLLGWDEILDGGLAPNATVMSWRGTEGGLKAMAMGHRAIMTPGEYCYLDAYQDAPHTQPEAFGGYLTLQKVYSYDPVPDTLSVSQRELLYGVQGNLFAEYIPTEEHLEYMAYPRMLALAEVAWSVPENKEYENFRARALEAVDELRAKGYNTFDLRTEVGNRPGADKPIEHLGVGKRVAYVDGSAYYSGYTAGGDSPWLTDFVVDGPMVTSVGRGSWDVRV